MAIAESVLARCGSASWAFKNLIEAALCSRATGDSEELPFTDDMTDGCGGFWNTSGDELVARYVPLDDDCDVGERLRRTIRR